MNTDINFIKGEGGTKSALPNEDHISAFLFCRTYTPPAAAPVIPMQPGQVASLADAVSKGITEALYPVYYSQIKEFFAINKNATLFVGFENGADGVFDFATITALQQKAAGKIRQIGVLSDAEFDVADLTKLQAVYASLFATHMPLEIYYGADFTGIEADALADLRARTQPNVHVILAANADFICAVDSALGYTSLAKVSENIGYIKKFNAATSGKYEVLYFATGDAYDDLSDLYATLVSKGYMFLEKQVGRAGSYWQDTHSCCPVTSDYAYAEQNRTIDKAIRGIRYWTVPELKGDHEFNSDGTLAEPDRQYLQNIAGNELENMLKNKELSAFEVAISPEAYDTATNRIAVKFRLIKRNVIRGFDVTIGYTVSL